MNLFKLFRIGVLLSLLVCVAFYAKTQQLKSTAWIEPLNVVIYPINGDRSPDVEDYIAALDESVFADIGEFFRREGRKYEIPVETPISISLGPKLDRHPPVSPPPGADIMPVVWWGLKFRIWAYRNTPDDKSNLSRVRVFLHYHEAKEGKKLQHSLGLDKGLLAVVHAFAARSQQAQNNIVIAHELLHTVGATDKYGDNSEPVYPGGYADPQQWPLFPQKQAEIMAARIPLSPKSSKMAKSLELCVVGQQTAREINWIRADESTD